MDEDDTPESSPESPEERPRSSGRRRRRRRSSRVVIEGDTRGDAKTLRRKRRRSRRGRDLFSRRNLAVGLGAVLLTTLGGFLAFGILDLRFLVSGGYEIGLEQYESREYRSALRTLNEVLQGDPDNLAARILLGRTYLAVGYSRESETELRRALSAGADAHGIVDPLGRALLAQGKFDDLFATLSPRVPDLRLRHSILVLRGEAHLRLRETVAAEEAFQGALAIEPESAAALQGRATIELRRGNARGALEYVDRALTTHPQSTALWRARAAVQLALGDAQSALSDYGRALEIDPGDGATRIERALLGVQLGRTAQVEVDLEALPEVLADDGQTLFVRALAAARAGDGVAAGLNLDRAQQRLVRLHGAFLRTYPPGQLVQGLVRYRAGEPEEAYDYLARYLDYVPHDAFVRKLVADLLVESGRAQGALEILAPVVKAHQDDVQALVILGRAYLWLRDREQANALLAQAAERTPDPERLATDLAYLRLAQGEQGGAADGADELIRPEPGPTQAAALLATLQLRAGDLAGARGTAERQVSRRPDSPAAHAMLAAVLLRTDDLARANESIARALAIDGTHVPSLHVAARLDLRAGAIDRAQSRLNAILERDTGDVGAMVALAAIARDGGREDAALGWYEKVRTAPGAPLAPLLDLLELHLDAGRLQQAQALVGELQDRFPRSVEVRVARGRVELAGGDSRRASQTFTSLASTSRASPGRLLEFARYQLAAGDTDAARTTLAQALEADWNHVPSQLQLARLDLDSKRHSEALARARMVTEMDGGAVAAWTLAGDALMRLDRYDDAAVAYRTGFERAPDTTLAVRVFEAQLANGRITEGVAELERWVRGNPDGLDARRALAVAYMAAGRDDQALSAHEQLIGALPDDALLHRNLAELYRARNDPRALKHAERAFRLSPQDVQVLDTLGWVLLSTNEAREALTHLREAHSRAARDPRIRYHIAVALERLGRHDEARRELDAALAEGVAFEEEAAARELRGRL